MKKAKKLRKRAAYAEAMHTAFCSHSKLHQEPCPPYCMVKSMAANLARRMFP